MEKLMQISKMHHFVLVHGLGCGAWAWYKVRTLLESLGHKVTAPDLAASGINLQKLREVDTMLEYSEPLMEFMAAISNKEKVILVGHSLGGMSIAYAMDKFPEKVSVAVFLTAFMPVTTHCPSYVLDKFFEVVPEGAFLDTRIIVERGRDMPKTTLLWGLEFMAAKVFQRSPPEDHLLATMLVRVGSTFQEDLATAPHFTEQGYGSVNRAFVVCGDDKTIPAEFQKWMIGNNPVKEVKQIEGADHFAMTSKPQQVCQALLELANKYE